jgi:guanylate kinase
MGRLIVLAGPSCAGKSPLLKALQHHHADLAADLTPLVLYNSRAPRPGEQDGQDYHFRTRNEISALDGEEGFVVMDVRGDLQAVDTHRLRDDLSRGDILFEGNPFVATHLLEMDLGQAELLSMFLSPLSREELEFLADPARPGDVKAVVADVMRRKLLRRTRHQKGELSRGDLDEIERRCTSAYHELTMAWRFQHVLVNHDGEDSENWDAFHYPLGEARLAVESVAALLSGQPCHRAETWPENLLSR